ncbi:hypothetical protein MSAN_01955700 [Mycena sanguinolenta]|uniref:Uncharacterized protein n=1 Tax=Mycena sanguinolenta TaxID=230812 RepID=A0A8H7CPQ6_9AGAR|nr:hypothetical protein MSAN_01955700 [Mycena sanguinolenta]
MIDLPAEVWTQVFDLAADEDVIFRHGLPTTMEECAWTKNVRGEWAVRSPQDQLNLVQRRSYATKKAIVGTCKKWRDLGSEFLFRCLFFSDPARVLTLCALLDSSVASTTASASLGWWTRRIHLTRFHSDLERATPPQALQDALVSLIRHCPNLEIFIIDWPMRASIFGPVADTLGTFAAKTLRTLHIVVPSSALGKVIWALDSLRHISAAYVKLEEAKDEELHLGAASSIHLRLPALQHLALKGHIQDFVEQAAGWALPALRHLSINCGNGRADLPDTLAFLSAHGTDLTSLDLYAIPAMPLARILALCPALTTLAFNGDWRVLPSSDEDGEGDTPPLAHDRITHVGLHGLAYAFGVGFGAAYAEGDRLPALVVANTNDRTLDLLTARAAFPALRTVRVLSPDLLEALDRADGPAPGEGMKRWERWWQGCTHVGVRLEDCTGGMLGELPMDPVESDSEEEESEVEGELVDGDTDEEESDEDEYDASLTASPHRPHPSRSRREDREWRTSIPAQGGPQLDELRQLLAECRAMDAGRDDNYLFRNPGAMAIMGVGEGGWVLMRSGSALAAFAMTRTKTHDGLYICFDLFFHSARPDTRHKLSLFMFSICSTSTYVSLLDSLTCWT